ncbi:MAG: V-type ATP synthase subunit E [Spirochaetaceae bacterium]|jgi:V/A-type H+-transporting ATPase subunit E|nr:V-type ATP synthase subunit E [Spirochaetaceae bacterium]
MDIQLQELIEKIKKEGIESANDEALKIKGAAEAEAKRTVEAARKEAEAVVAKGKADAERFEKAGVAAVEQASRNLVLAFKSEIEGLLGKIISKEVAKTYNNDVLKAVIPEVVKGWLDGKGAVDLILDEARLSTLRSWSTSALAAEIAKGVELKVGRNVGAGFRIGEKDGSAYYDFSASAVAGALADYLNPQLAEILKNGAKGL